MGGFALAGAVAVVALAGAPGVAVPGPGPPVSVVLQATQPVDGHVDYPHPLWLGGHVDDGEGNRVPGQAVLLQATRFPYTDPFETIARTRSGDTGVFSFAPRPDRSTRYRAVLSAAPEIASPVVQNITTIAPQGGFGTVTLGRRALGRLEFKVRHPPDLRLARRRVRFYWSPPRGRRYRLGARGRVRALSTTRALVRSRYFRIARSRSPQFRYVFCIEGLPDLSPWGDPASAPHPCPGPPRPGVDHPFPVAG